MPPTPKGFSRLWFGAAPKPSSEMENAAAFSFPMMLPSSSIVLMSSRRTAKPIADNAVEIFPRDLANAAAADGERGLAGQQGRIDVAVDHPLRAKLRHADAERQAEIRTRPVLDPSVGAEGAGRCGRLGIEGGEGAMRGGAGRCVVFQRVETGIDRQRRVLQRIAELHA